MNRLRNKFNLLVKLNKKPYIDEENNQFVRFNVSISVPSVVNTVYDSFFWESINLLAPSDKLTVNQFNLNRNQNVFIEGHLQTITINNDSKLVGMIDNIDIDIDKILNESTNVDNKSIEGSLDSSLNSNKNKSNEDVSVDSSSSDNKSNSFNPFKNSSENSNKPKSNNGYFEGYFELPF